MISGFEKEHNFLSSFYPTPIHWEGILYISAENAFQAAKCRHVEDRHQFATCSPGQAKRMGRKIPLRADWEDAKRRIMRAILLIKFRKGSPLHTQLLQTGDRPLREDNTWHDQIWGNCICGSEVCTSLGKNLLGELLMEVRTTLRGKES